MFMGRDRSLRRHLVLHELLMVILLHLFCTQLAGKTSRLAYIILISNMLLTLPSDLYLIFYILSKHFNLILIKLYNFMVEHLSTNFGLNVFKVARSSFLARAA